MANENLNTSPACLIQPGRQSCAGTARQAPERHPRRKGRGRLSQALGAVPVQRPSLWSP